MATKGALSDRKPNPQIVRTHDTFSVKLVSADILDLQIYVYRMFLSRLVFLFVVLVGHISTILGRTYLVETTNAQSHADGGSGDDYSGVVDHPNDYENDYMSDYIVPGK